MLQALEMSVQIFLMECVLGGVCVCVRGSPDELES